MRLPSLAVLRTQSDDRLVALARAGSEQAFEAIVERYRRPLLRHAQRLLTETGAEDAVQQAFLAAWTALRRGDDVRELRAWLHRIVHNVALNVLRGAPLREHAELLDNVAAGSAPEEELERRMTMRRTLADVAALPERQREAVLAVAVQGRSQEEVARALGLSHGAVAQLVLRGRRALRAAASALTPQPLLNWLATLGSEGPPAASLTLGKVAAVVAVAGTATTGPALIEHQADRMRPVAEARAQEQRSAPPRTSSEAAPSGGGRIAPPPLVERNGSGSSGSGSGHSGSSGSGSSGSGSSGSGSSGSGSSGSSGSGSSGSDSSGSGSGSSGSGTSGSGTSGSGTSGSGTSGSGTSGSGTSGSGSSGSDSSGSGSSGSDSSGSGSSGSGSSGSGSSGSGSSGSGSSVSDSSGSGSSVSDSSGSDSSGSGSGDDAH